MKHERLFAALSGAILGFCLSVSSALCLVNAFSLTLVSPVQIVLTLGILSLVCGFAFCTKYGRLAVLCILAVAAGYLAREGTAQLQLQAIITAISQRYDGAYHWGYLYFPLVGEKSFPADLPVLLLGSAIAVLVCRATCRHRSAFWPLMLALLPLGLCLVVTDITPEPRYLAALLVSGTLLLLTGTVRRESAAQGFRLLSAALLPTFLAAALVLQLALQADYAQLSDRLRSHLPSREGITAGIPGFVGTDNPQPNADLSNLGSLSREEIPILQVKSPKSGSLYLRGQDYDTYVGTRWHADEKRSEVFSGQGESSGDVVITTFAARHILYIPYYPGNPMILSGGLAPNTKRKMVYSFPLCGSGSGSTQSAEELARYLTLPEETERWAKEITDPITGSPWQKAAVIGAAVRSLVPYSLDTSAMPETETDFAQWFWNRAETGYCVHFATTAAVLLRAAGIPARYVTGFKTETRAGETVVVTAADAHAWAEYYDSDLESWRILEATPPDPEAQAENESPAFPTAAPTETTEAAETTTATESTTAPQPVMDDEEDMPTASAEETEPEPESAPMPKSHPELRVLGLVLSGIAAAAGLLGLRRALVLALRKERQRRMEPNALALHLWQEIQTLTARLEETPPEQLQELALKALFSQHTLRPEEITVFRKYRHRCRCELKKRPWYQQLADRYLRLLY